MIEVVRFGDTDYKRCCGNCEFHNSDEMLCENLEKIKYVERKKLWVKRYLKSDIGCKYFSFEPNIPYTGDAEIRVVEVVRLSYDKKEFTVYKKHKCNHRLENGKSALADCHGVLTCILCKDRFIKEEK